MDGTLHTLHEKALADLKAKRDTVDRAVALCNDPAVGNALAFAQFALEPLLQEPGTSVYVFSGYERMIVNVYCEVSSMKEGPLAESLERATNLDRFETISSHDITSSGQRQFTLEMPKLKLEITATPKDDVQGTCRKVQVGKQQIEVPVYEVRCD